MNDHQDQSLRFLDEVKNDLEDGYHFIPFLGAGFSQSAGFPNTTQLANYHLPYWIIRALELNPLATRIEDLTERRLARWHPRDGWWPISGEELLGACEDAKEAKFSYEQARKLLEWAKIKKLAERKPETRRESSGKIVRASMDTLQRALDLLPPKDSSKDTKDWLKLVQFLACLTRRSENPDRLIYAGTERQSVVDSLFIHLNRSSQPALGHHLIAALATVWKSRVILTTNFDTLLEQAFAEIREPLEVFEVPKTAPLPDAHLVLSQPSLVKLHGGRFDVRADLSVGALLGREDMKNALSYVAGRALFPSDRLTIPGGKGEKAAIVFFGCGGKDERTNNFAQFVAQHFDKAKIYWLSLSPKKVEDVPMCQFFREEGDAKQAFLHDYQDFGLLLLHLYQHLTHTIPTSGALFPGPWQLSSPPRIPLNEDASDTYTKSRNETAKLLERHIETAFPKDICQTTNDTCTATTQAELPTQGQHSRPLFLALGDNNYGGADICLTVFNNIKFQRDHGSRCLWIDLDEVTMPSAVFSRILMMTARLEGVIDPLTTLDLNGLSDLNLRTNFTETVKRGLISHHANCGLRLVVFLNMTEAPGDFSLYALDNESEETANTTDGNPEQTATQSNDRWRCDVESGEVKHFFELIIALNDIPACGVQFVVVAPHDRSKFVGTRRGSGQDDYATTGDKVLNSLSAPSIGEARVTLIRAENQVSPFLPMGSAASALEWSASCVDGQGLIDKSQQRLRLCFLVLLVAFRQSRYPAALARIFRTYLEQEQSGAKVSGDYHDICQWLRELEGHRVVRFRDGGFVWLNNQVQRLIIEKLQKPLPDYHDISSKMHAGIARWYGRLLLASADPLAAVEGIYQNIEGVINVAEEVEVAAANAQSQGSVAPELPERSAQVDAMLGQARFLLDTARSLFERRLATTFADRSLSFLGHKLFKLLGDQYPENKLLAANESRIRKRIQVLAEELAMVRATVALREARFHYLCDEVSSCLDSGKLQLSSPDRVNRLQTICGAANLLLRNYVDAEGIFQKMWSDCLYNSSIKPLPSDVLEALPADIWISGIRTTTPTIGNGVDSSIWSAASAARRIALVWEFRAEDETTASSPSPKTRLRKLIRLAHWGVYLHLNRSLVVFVNAVSVHGGGRLGEKGRVANSDATKLRIADIQRAEWLLQFGLELLRSASDTGDGFVFEESVRLRSHGALVYAIIESREDRPDDAPPRFTRSWSLLRDADSFLGDFPLQEVGVNAAIVRLRAAEICLLEVHSLAWFKDVRRAIRALAPPSQELAVEQTSDLAEKVTGLLSSGNLPRDQGSFNRVAARVTEAIEWLEKAEAALIPHPKSRWWWWIFVVLKMRACAYLYTVRFARGLVGDREPRSEPRVIPSSVFRFIESGLRRLIHEKDLGDCFYLARVVSSYAEVFRNEALYAVAYGNGRTDNAAAEEQMGTSRPALLARARTLRVLIVRLKELKGGCGNEEVKIYADRCINRGEQVIEGWNAASPSPHHRLRP